VKESYTFLFLILHVTQAILSLKIQRCPCAQHECMRGIKGLVPLIFKLTLERGERSASHPRKYAPKDRTEGNVRASEQVG
jgi:hypothetical protein